MGGTDEAVEALVEIGLTEYEARCFVALTQLSEGTAEEIARIAEVPQSRVYDVAEQLHRRGVVDVQASEPRRYYALPAEEALDRLQREYTDTIDAARDRLLRLDARETDSDGVWQVVDREAVVARIAASVADASEEVYLLVADEALVDGELVTALEEAASGDAAVYAEVPTASARDRLLDAVPSADAAISPLSLDSQPADGPRPGRLVMVDRNTVLLSALREGSAPGEPAETGLWSTEVGHGLVLWLRPLLAARLEALSFESA